MCAPLNAEQQPSLPKVVREETATIYFFRSTNLPENVLGLLSLDRVEIGQVNIARYAVVRVKPGSHELKLSFPLWAKVNDQAVIMEFERDKNYYLSYATFTSSRRTPQATGEAMPSIESELKFVTEVDAKLLMAKYERAFVYDENKAALVGNSTTPAGSLASADNGHTTAEPNHQVILLDPFVISEKEQLSFHFSIRVIREQPANRIVEMYVDRVLDGSNAHEVGLMKGAKIVAIDGKAVELYEATFLNDSPLRKIFINRREGDEVALTVINPGENNRRHIVVTRRKVVLGTLK